ncbi:ribosome biogenesis GTPase Der [Microbulbifer flavimaris]|uniref:GTPase Der n=1 Tax=Microbulbifer flavimaris TaxID=1781068 RepID=A0ABX4HWH0_9GAMM|nr:MULTISPECIES: ribosome biogenesis GTPase Der [Microbulbifer]KUJ81502.1 ribosome biogenesis GTPase Der [Microbulbifer sp. ZGT114]PCO04411.1 ribosome biogenesis GTPase Der [Microbulbifer flavimaris]
MLPVIALVGRPNVGKSTLFNRLTKSRDALVANYAGLTRDRKYGEAEIDGKKMILVDTGGITGGEEGIDAAMAQQSMQAIEEADFVLFLVDCRDGLTPADEMIAEQLRNRSKPTLLVANKVDGVNPDIALAPFYELGIGELFPTTATHGRGVRSLMQRVADGLPEQAAADEEEDEATGVKIAIVGRPNVGKSTLVNRLLGEERVVVYDQPGTTRDSVYINYDRDGKPYTLIDTAGIRRRKNIKESVEKFSIVKTLQAVEDANVVVLVIDAREGLVDQDMHLMGSVIQAGRALVVALNKWDGLEADHRDFVKTELERRLRFVDFADIHFISALHGTGVGHLYESIEAAYQSATDKLSTNHLTRILQWAVSEHQPPLVHGHRIKLRYAHAGGQNPPVIVIHGNQTEKVPSHYVRYLEKTFRKALELHGTPVKIEFRTGDNPYAGRKNKLTDRQKAKKRRLMKFVKKKK